MILIRNTQKKININQKKLQQDAQKILDILGYNDFDLGIWLTTNTTIKKYNHNYRNKDKPTDILSFPYHSDLKAGDKISATTDEDRNLGDIIISPEYVKKDSPRWGHSFEQHMQMLLVHGICHLLGYDHIKDQDYAVMKKQENFLLKKLSQ
ncbi:rRNA maturation RNase YbeY [Candidatus Dependentiae bacterium]|nr:rRNA maturation RNase YbeY [Candidatus Dependentiae bacterium]